MMMMVINMMITKMNMMVTTMTATIMMMMITTTMTMNMEGMVVCFVVDPLVLAVVHCIVSCIL